MQNIRTYPYIDNKILIGNIPEVKLSHSIQKGDTSILEVGMNQCGAALIKPQGIKTVFTGGLNGCNGVLVIAKGLDGNHICILSHYTPLPKSVENNKKALEAQLQKYSYYIDPKTKPLILFNMPGEAKDTGVLIRRNDSLNEFKAIFRKFIRDFDEQIIPYVDNKSISILDSSAIIAEFHSNLQNSSEIKITTVGQKIMHKVLKSFHK